MSDLTIATICARGGSKGVPGKNIREINGKPLICWTIEQALSHPAIDEVYVSTDCNSIADIAKSSGARVPFIRPKSLATDDAAKLPVVRHLVDWVINNDGLVDRIVDLDPTSPLRNASDISDCLKLLDQGAPAVITAYKSDKNPYFNMVEKNSDESVCLSKTLSFSDTPVSRQQAPPVYAMNASIYCWTLESLAKGIWQDGLRLHEMPRERSIDIDDIIDFRLVELMMSDRVSG